MRKRFAPDLDKLSQEDFDFRLRAQYLVHLLMERELAPDEYLELVEIVESFLQSLVDQALAKAGPAKEAHAKELLEQMSRPTNRPIALPMDLDWGKQEDETK